MNWRGCHFYRSYSMCSFRFDFIDDELTHHNPSRRIHDRQYKHVYRRYPSNIVADKCLPLRRRPTSTNCIPMRAKQLVTTYLKNKHEPCLVKSVINWSLSVSDGSSMVLLDTNRSLADVRAVCEQYEDVGMLMNPSTIVQHNFSRNIPEFNVSKELNKYLSCGGQFCRQTCKFRHRRSYKFLSQPHLVIA